MDNYADLELEALLALASTITFEDYEAMVKEATAQGHDALRYIAARLKCGPVSEVTMEERQAVKAATFIQRCGPRPRKRP